ncbi:MAG: L-serine ammonia-lyase, partial [Betaproteobacteria bacterium]
MAISVFDLFKIGIGPSSSHTVGPMRAARLFVTGLKSGGELAQTVRVKADLYGSLGATGKGHGSDKAVLLGWLGETPDEIDPDRIPELLATIRTNASVPLLHEHPIAFDEKADLVFHRRESLPFHPNGMRFAAFDAAGNTLREKTYYSVGGGFVVNADAVGRDHLVEDATDLRYPFTTGDGLLAQCKASGLSIAQLMLANELRWHSEDEVRANLLKIWRVMQDCVKRGCEREGELPGGMRVKRRAPGLRRSLIAKAEKNLPDPLSMLDWVNLYAMAVNEENAAGGRVVTAPTNGAAGIIPAVLHYYARFCPGSSGEGVVDFLLTAAAIGILYK